MKRTHSSQSLALSVLTAVVGGFVGASASTAYITSDVKHHSVREDRGTILRSTDMEILEQDRRTARIRAQQEATHAAASEVEATEELDARAYFQAQRWCIFNGYDHPRRLASCVFNMMQAGTYSPID